MLTQFAFWRLLAWLDDGTDSRGERYVEIRARLVAYFDRRGRWAADELADETLNRIARTLEQTGAIAVRPPARYCFVIARFVLLEDVRRERRHVPVDESWHGRLARPDPGWVQREEHLDRLDRCLSELKPRQRDLIVEYYTGRGPSTTERRRALARRLGITMNALAIRAWRIRDGLVTRVAACR